MKDIITEIRQRIVEEMGISDTVKNISKDIITNVIKDSKTLKYASYKTNTFLYNYNENIIDVIYNLYYVNDINEFIAPIKNGESEMIGNKHYRLVITIVYERKTNKYIDYDGVTQHEFEHIYKMIETGKPLIIKNKSLELYKKAQSLIQNSNVFKQIVGYVIYYNNQFEADGLTNGIYKQIIDNPDKDPYDVLKSTITYKNIYTIKKYVIDENHQNEFTKIIKNSFNKEYNWFYNMTYNVIKTYINKMGKVFTKARNDYLNERTILDGDKFIGSVIGKPIIEN